MLREALLKILSAPTARCAAIAPTAAAEPPTPAFAAPTAEAAPLPAAEPPTAEFGLPADISPAAFTTRRATEAAISAPNACAPSACTLSCAYTSGSPARVLAVGTSADPMLAVTGRSAPAE